MFVIFAHAELTAHNTLGSCTDSNRGKEQNVFVRRERHLRQEHLVSHSSYSSMPIERRKRAEWERLLTHHHAARLDDLPDELRELVGKLDEKLGVQQSERQEHMRRKPLNSLTPLRGRQTSPRLDLSLQTGSALSWMMTGVGLSVSFERNAAGSWISLPHQRCTPAISRLAVKLLGV